MPIRHYLDGERFDPETTRLLGIAFETAIQALRNRGVVDPPREAIARAIIERQLGRPQADAGPRRREEVIQRRAAIAALFLSGMRIHILV